MTIDDSFKFAAKALQRDHAGLGIISSDVRRLKIEGDPHVFDDIRRVFEEYQATRTPEPDDIAEYAGLTACVGHWGDADRIFQTVPPQNGRIIYISPTMGHRYEELRKEAARLAAEPAK